VANAPLDVDVSYCRRGPKAYKLSHIALIEPYLLDAPERLFQIFSTSVEAISMLEVGVMAAIYTFHWHHSGFGIFAYFDAGCWYGHV